MYLPQNHDDGTPPICQFTNVEKRMKVRYVMYCDLEALNVPSNGPNTVNLKRLADHIPSGYGITVIDTYENCVVDHEVYRGIDAVSKFVDRINQLSLTYKTKLEDKKVMKKLTAKQRRQYYESKTCHICRETIFKHETKVRDHCHITGDYRGPAHWDCNVKFTHMDRIPVCFHNFRNYDSQLLIDNLKTIRNQKVTIIPHNTEKFTSIITKNYIIIDTFLHTTSSLEGLVDSLEPSTISNEEFIEKFKPMVDIFGLKKAKLLSKKGIYPYEYMSSFEKFKETKFPSKIKFYSKLRGENITNEDYEFGVHIYETYCNNLGDYHDLYLETDTLLLASCFENFRKVVRKHYGLDPLHYLSLPGLAWDAALFNTKVKLELITDEKMYYLLELSLRGGVCMISERLAEANNQFMPGNLRNPDDHNSFIFYIDKNNLYGEALCDYLPVGNFRFENNDVTVTDILNWKSDAETGYILNVDLEYPKELHDDSSHLEYPLAPEKIAIAKENLSPYQKDLLGKFKLSYNSKGKKLIPHLGPRKQYVLHYKNLQYYLKKGMKLTKVHDIIAFDQRAWLRKFVTKNALLRSFAKSKFEQDLFKLINNSVFGKSMQQMRNRMQAKIIDNSAILTKHTRKSNFSSFQILQKNLAILFMKQPKVTLDRPIYTAFTVLELSKLYMYKWHYDKIKKWYGDDAKFLYTDTDSLTYKINTNNLYEDLREHAHEFDFSDYDPSNKNNGFLHCNKNKKVIGRMKDEAKGKIIYSFVGIAPKMYSMEGEKNFEIKKAKGVKRKIIERVMKHEHFKNSLSKQRAYVCRMNLIRSKKHKLFLGNFKKSAIHCFDSKTYILADGITSRPHFHYKNYST